MRRILASGTDEVPKVERHEQLAEHLEKVRTLYADCAGNLVRVQEDLEELHQVRVAYPTLTHFCRKNGIGVAEVVPAGEYEFAPGQEMQFDTSPHDVILDGHKTRLQCASLVLCFSRMLFIQLYEVFTRFIAKVFLTDALRYFGGAAGQCEIDNTSVVVAHGSGAKAVMAPEMAMFAERFGFKFVAHAVGDANRSARVERPFDYVEGNFYAGRTFKDRKDLNAQALAWSDQRNAKFKRTIQATPTELFQKERLHLVPLPAFVPEPYALHRRTVDLERRVNVHTNRYSVPAAYIGRVVVARETKDRIFILRGHTVIAEHERREFGARQKATLPEHRHPGRALRRSGAQPLPEELVLRAGAPELGALIDAVRNAHGGRCVSFVKRMHTMYLTYPLESLRTAIQQALAYGLTDLSRIERMVLKTTAGEYFLLPTEPEDTDE